MAVVWRALTRIPLRAGLSVAIIGDGTIALLAAHLGRTVRSSSESRWSADGLSSASWRCARGAQEFLTETPTAKFDLVIEAAGNAAAVSSAIQLCARGGMVVLLGLPPHGTKVEIAPDDLVNDDLIIQASFSYTRTAFAEVVERLNAQELRPSFLITHRFGLEHVDSAVATLRGAPPLDSSPGEADGALTAVAQPRGKVVVEIASS